MPANMGFPSPPPIKDPTLLQKILGGLVGSPANSGAVDPAIQQAARQQALMAMSAQLLAGSGPSPQRTSFGQALGPALLAGQQANQQGIDSALQTQLLMSQIQRNKQKEQQNKNHVIGNALVDDTGKVVYQGSALDNTFGRVNPGDYTPDSLKKFAESGNWADLKRVWAPPSPTVVQMGGAPNLVQGDRNGAPPTITPLSTPEDEAEAKRRLAAAQAGGSATGTAVATAQLTLPQIEQNTQQAIDAIDQLIAHPGLPYITGLYSKAPIIPGTPQAGADALAQQVQGAVFTQAYESLRGAQGITDIEGRKAEAAKARLQRAQTRREYIQAANELKGILKTGVENARRKANTGTAAAQSAQDDPLGIRR